MTSMTRTGIRSIVLALAAALSIGVASAQTPSGARQATPAANAAQPKPAATAPQPVAAVSAPSPEAPPDVYSYNPEGRRDPFVSLIIKGSEARARENRPEGPAGLSISEIALRGIIKSRAEYVALVQGPDKKTYIVHTGDKLFDGSVKLIAADVIVFAEDVNDPLSLVKQREVRKALRTTEEGK